MDGSILFCILFENDVFYAKKLNLQQTSNILVVIICKGLGDLQAPFDIKACTALNHGTQNSGLALGPRW